MPFSPRSICPQPCPVDQPSTYATHEPFPVLLVPRALYTPILPPHNYPPLAPNRHLPLPPARTSRRQLIPPHLRTHYAPPTDTNQPPDDATPPARRDGGRWAERSECPPMCSQRTHSRTPSLWPETSPCRPCYRPCLRPPPRPAPWSSAAASWPPQAEQSPAEAACIEGTACPRPACLHRPHAPAQ